jgi:hypothetical protein
MNQRRRLRGWKVAGLALVAVPVIMGVFGLLVKSLWNWLMPELFGLRMITFWQALGLWILSRILLAGFQGRGRKYNRRWEASATERWERLSPEEREQLRERLRRRCEPFEEEEPSS